MIKGTNTGTGILIKFSRGSIYINWTDIQEYERKFAMEKERPVTPLKAQIISKVNVRLMDDWQTYIIETNPPIKFKRIDMVDLKFGNKKKIYGEVMQMANDREEEEK